MALSDVRIHLFLNPLQADALERDNTVSSSCDKKVHARVCPEPKEKELASSAEKTPETSATVTVYPIGCSSDTHVQNSCLPVLVAS